MINRQVLKRDSTVNDVEILLTCHCNHINTCHFKWSPLKAVELCWCVSTFVKCCVSGIGVKCALSQQARSKGVKDSSSSPQQAVSPPQQYVGTGRPIVSQQHPTMQSSQVSQSCFSIAVRIETFSVSISFLSTC